MEDEHCHIKKGFFYHKKKISIKIHVLIFSYCVNIFIFENSINAQWIQLNGPFGGHINVLTSIQSAEGEDGAVLFVGTEGAGIYRSTNKGVDWIEVNNGLSNLFVRVFATTMNTDSSINLFAGTDWGVFLSKNNGLSWEEVNIGLTDNYICAFAVTRNNDGSSNLFAGTKRSGICLSINNGKSWIAVNNGLSSPEISTLTAVNHVNGSSDVYATAYNIIFHSTNNGVIWTVLNDTLGMNSFGCLVAYPDSSGGSILYAGSYGQFFYSTDSGVHWIEKSSGLPNGRVKAIIQQSNTLVNSNLIVGTERGIYKSTNDNSNWTYASNGIIDREIQTLLELPIGKYQYSTLFAGSYGSGVYVSTDDGVNWTASNNGINNCSITSLMTIPRSSNGMFIVAGTTGGVFLSPDGGKNWSSIHNDIQTPIIYCLAVDTNNDGSLIFFVGGSQFLKMSSDTGTSWKSITPSYFYGIVHAIQIAQNTAGHRKYFLGASDGFYFSIDTGKTWTQIWLPFASYNIGHLIAVPNSPSGTTLIAGTSQGIYRSIDEGINWDWSSYGMNYTAILSLASCFNRLTGLEIYTGTGVGGVYVSNDNAKNWIQVKRESSSLPVNALFKSGRKLFAGTSNGLLLSEDNNNWTDITGEITNKDIRKLTIGTDELGDTIIFVGTHGGGIWQRFLSEITGIEMNKNDIPNTFTLFQNYPNPFNPTTTIKYQIPHLTNIKLQIFDLLGREVITLTNEQKQPGVYSAQWDGTDNNGNTISSGVYFCRLQTANFQKCIKLLLLK
jgi:photosystem II stability/assembly factor-like uncharacterized protein